MENFCEDSQVHGVWTIEQVSILHVEGNLIWEEVDINLLLSLKELDSWIESDLMVLLYSLTGLEVDDVLLSLMIWAVHEDVVLSQCQIWEGEVSDESELIVHSCAKVLDIEIRLSLDSSKVDDAFEVHSKLPENFTHKMTSQVAHELP